MSYSPVTKATKLRIQVDIYNLQAVPLCICQIEKELQFDQVN